MEGVGDNSLQNHWDTEGERDETLQNHWDTEGERDETLQNQWDSEGVGDNSSQNHCGVDDVGDIPFQDHIIYFGIQAQAEGYVTERTSTRRVKNPKGSGTDEGLRART